MIGMHAKGTSEAYPIVELDKIADRIHDLSVRVGQLSGPVIASSMPDEQSLEGT